MWGGGGGGGVVFFFNDPATTEIYTLSLHDALPIYSQLAAFSADAKRAGDLLAFGETKRDESLDLAKHAAWTTVASAIFNLDEVITKE